MKTLKKAIQFLLDLERWDLAELLKASHYSIVQEEVLFLDDVYLPAIEITSPPLISEALDALPDYDKTRILDSIIRTDESMQNYRGKITSLSFTSDIEQDLEPRHQLIAEIICQREQMISVATGKSMIQSVNDYYHARRRRIQELLTTFNITDPNPYKDLWEWYHEWKKSFPKHADRRAHVKEIYLPLIQQLCQKPSVPSPPREPTGWVRVDRVLEKARDKISFSKNEEDSQTVGLLCREVLISLGQAVFDPDIHKSTDGVTPSDTDAFRMIDAFVSTSVSGSSNENIRKHAKASLQLALELQHKRTADFRTAALCLEATSSIVNIIAIISGRRDPD